MSKYTDRIKELRNEKEITQTQLANELCLSSPSRLRMWESGASEPSIDMLVQIAEYFQVSVDYLISNTNVRNNKHAEFIETQLGPETAKAYKNLLDDLSQEVVKWENHPLVSGNRASSYLCVLSHDLKTLGWLSEKPTIHDETPYNQKKARVNLNSSTGENLMLIDMSLSKQILEIESNKHNNFLRQLLLDNQLRALQLIDEQKNYNSNSL